MRFRTYMHFNVSEIFLMSTIYIDRVSFADSMEQFEMDDEIKESDNPLYSSRSDYQWE